MSTKSSRPNILLIIADDHRSDAMGAMGHAVVSTPNLDVLARRGTSFTRAIIGGGLMAAVCAPSRAALFTGLNPFRADAEPRIRRSGPYEVRLRADICTLPGRFRQEGYDTFFTGKWHNDLPSLLRSFASGDMIFHGGMCDHERVPVRNLDEISHGAPERIATGFSTALFCGAAEEFIRSRAMNGGESRANPFFACMALTSPHDPRTPPPSFRARYSISEMPLPDNFLPQHAFDNGELCVRDEQLIARPISPMVLREHLADYYGMISHHDAWIGRLLNALASTGQLGNTIVVYTGDHGLALGSHGLLGKQNLYEHSVRVPLVLAGPGIPEGLRSDSLCYAYDLCATLYELAGIPVPKGIDSRSLVPALAAGSRFGRDRVGSAYMDVQRMVEDRRWKLILYRVGERERMQLFDLENDPSERFDLSSLPEHQETLKGLRRSLEAWQAEMGDRWMTVSPTAGKLGPALP
ncbi:MAG: sulfatase-like hydrolase/transferase [Opitutaceae bacterium]|nr:sulfatase-like hydrolase/transferase [Opitutaceae bacterium]